jgi:hypothetical protein
LVHGKQIVVHGEDFEPRELADADCAERRRVARTIHGARREYALFLEHCLAEKGSPRR